MVPSIQRIQTGTTNLNRVGFAAENEKKPEAEQTQAPVEISKDGFVKKEEASAVKKENPAVRAVRKGAAAGLVVGLGLHLMRQCSLLGVAITGVGGAALGAIFSKKD